MDDLRDESQISPNVIKLTDRASLVEPSFRTTIAELVPVVADLHATLAANTSDPAFVPEPYSSLDRRSKYQSLRNIAGKVFRELELHPDGALVPLLSLHRLLGSP
jgi:hypothetical protein